jgi:cobalt transporter subunit CbtB
LRYGIASILLGTLFIGVTGFAPLQALHDAAHNTRHAISFPCH